MNEAITPIARRILAVALTAALAACSGGGTSPVVPASGTQPAFAPIAFTMHWPSAQAVASMRAMAGVRRPSFVSPSTKSVVVEVNNDPTLSTTTNKPSSGDVSTVSINAPIGNDAITITTWDGAGGAGNLLGQITVSQAVVAGQLNTVNATVDGVMEKVGISAAPNPFLEPSQDVTGNPSFTIVGSVAQTFTIVPEDVDGNIIVPPGDAPTLAMVSNDGSVTVMPVAGRSGTYTVAAAYQTLPGSSVALRVSGTDGLGNTIASQFAIVESAAIYVGYAGPTRASVVIYDQAGKPIATTGTFSGIGDASAIAFDSKRNRLIVADAALGTLAAFDPTGAPDTTFAQPAITGVDGVVYDPDLDRLYATQGGQKTVAVFDGTGAPVSLSGTPFAGLTNPTSITYNPNYYGRSASAQLFVVDSSPFAPAQVPAFKPDGTAGSGSMVYAGTDSFMGIAAAYDPAVDKIFVIGAENAGSGNYPILREFDPNYGSIPQITATAGLSQPLGIAFNPVNYEIYVTNHGSGTIAVFSDSTVSSTFVADTSVTFVPPNGQTEPKGIAIVY